MLPRGGTESGPEFSSVMTQGPQLSKSGSAGQASGLQGGCSTQGPHCRTQTPNAPQGGICKGEGLGERMETWAKYD